MYILASSFLSSIEDEAIEDEDEDKDEHLNLSLFSLELFVGIHQSGGYGNVRNPVVD